MKDSKKTLLRDIKLEAFAFEFRCSGVENTSKKLKMKTHFKGSIIYIIFMSNFEMDSLSQI